MLDLNWETWTNDGTINPERYKIVAPRTTSITASSR